MDPYGSQTDEDGEKVIELDRRVAVPKNRPLGRAASRRSLSIHAKVRDSKGSGGAGGLMEAAKAVADMDLDDVAQAAPPQAASEEDSWLRDSLKRREAANAAVVLQEEMGEAEEAESSGFADEEVLEQYKIMALYEASIRVKENTGKSLEDYELKRKGQSEGDEGKSKKEIWGGLRRPKMAVPQPRIPNGRSDGNAGCLKSEPPVLGNFTKANYRRFINQTDRRCAELVEGEKVRTSLDAGRNEHCVRCAGCRCNLKVDLDAILVSCPACKVVNKASSSRN